jgi:hypothetical protein
LSVLESEIWKLIKTINLALSTCLVVLFQIVRASTKMLENIFMIKNMFKVDQIWSKKRFFYFV